MENPLEAIETIETMLEEGKTATEVWEALNDSTLTDERLDTIISILEEVDFEYFEEITNKIAIEIARSSPTLLDDLERAKPWSDNTRCTPADWQKPKENK